MIILAGCIGGKVALVAAVNGSAMGKVKAEKLLLHVASQINGRGGGRSISLRAVERMDLPLVPPLTVLLPGSSSI